MEYLLHLLVIISIYATVAVALDLCAGQAGMVSVAHAALFGIGAYSSAVVSVRVGLPFIMGLVTAIVVASVFSIMISLPIVRLRDDYFVIGTFVFQMIATNTFSSVDEITGGPLGLSGIPRPINLIEPFSPRVAMLAITIMTAGSCLWLTSRVVGSPYGRILRAIREDELLPRSLGKRVFSTKIKTFALSAAITGACGSLYAHYMRHIDPGAFSVSESIFLISMVIIGGAGSRWGPVLGAFILILIPEALRFIGLTHTIAAHLRQILYGALLVTFLIIRPRGLFGDFKFGN